MKTQTALLRYPWETRLTTVDLPNDPLPDHALIRVEACGICGTDLSTAADVNSSSWHPFGHEVAGIVEKVGANVTAVRLGTKVVLESSSFCGTCSVCRNGRVDLCNKAPNFWQQPAMGFSTYMMAPGCCLVPYDGLTPEAACLAEPAGVAYDMVKTAGIALGETVAVVGPGPIGLMAVALALRSGASEVWCIGRGHSAQRLKVAAAMGARVYPWDKSLGEAEDLHRKFNHVLLTAPVQHLPECLNLLSYGGELTYVGIGVGDGHVSFDANDFHFRKLQLRASFASPAIYYPHVLKLLAGKALDVNLLVSHRLALKHIDQAMHLCRDKKDTVVKVVVLPGADGSMGLA